MSNEIVILDGTVEIDLSECGLELGSWPCRLFLDRIGRPNFLDVQLSVTPKSWNGLTENPEISRGCKANISLADATTMVADLQLFSGWHGSSSDGMWAKFRLGESIWTKTPSAESGLWRFRLTNVKLRCADHVSEYVEGEVKREARNIVRFSVAGREWMLIDDFMGKWSDLDKLEMAHPLLTARLETPYQEADVQEDLEAIATNIEAILRLALSRAVTWVSCVRLVASDPAEEHYRSAWVAPFGISNMPINDGFQPGQIQDFIETTYTLYAADRDWFCNSITLYLLSQLGSHLEVRMSLQNTLLDRMAAKVLAGNDGAEIDPELPGRLDKKFKGRLHELLSELSSSWTAERTGQLVNTITNWNSAPSFPGGVERAAIQLGLEPLKKSLLSKRHKLIHLGEYDGTDGISVYDYWKYIECLVVMMLLRMLGYSGPFYHIAIGQKEKTLSDFMMTGTELPPYPIQGPKPDGELNTGRNEIGNENV